MLWKCGVAGLPEERHPGTSPPSMPLAGGVSHGEVWPGLMLIVPSRFSLLLRILSPSSLALAAYSGHLLMHHVIAQRDPFSELKTRSGEIFCVLLIQ